MEILCQTHPRREKSTSVMLASSAVWNSRLDLLMRSRQIAWNVRQFPVWQKLHWIFCNPVSPVLIFCYRKMRLRDEKGIPFPEYIFTKDDGTLIHPDTFSKHLKVLFVEIGLPKTYHMHTHRHFFISTLLHEGVDKNTVADLLVTETPLLPAASCFLKKTPDCINADRQIQRFNDLQTSDIRLFLQKGKDALMICI